MSKNLKRKALLMFVIEAVSLVLLGSVLMNLQSALTVNATQENIGAVLSTLSEHIDEANAETSATISEYDASYQARAAGVAFMIQNEVDAGLSGRILKNYAEMLEVDNLLIIDSSGRVLYKAEASPADFTRDRFNQLKQVVSTGENAAGFSITYDDGTTYRYYASPIDTDTLVVVETNPARLETMLESASSWQSVLRHISVGSDGFSFVISAKTNTVEYYPDEAYEGLRYVDIGLSAEEVTDGYYGWLSINGKTYYGGVYQSASESAYIFSVIPETEINANRNITVGVVLMVFFVVSTLLILYAVFIMEDEEKNPMLFDKNNVKLKKYYYNRSIAKKVTAISLLGLICIFAFSVYMQTLFALSQQALSNNNHVEQIQTTVAAYESEKEALEESYNDDYLDKCELVAYIINKKPELRTRAVFAELCEVLDMDYIYLFDDTGKTIVTNSTNVDFALSTNESDQSYAFRKLLTGTDYLVAKAQIDDLGYYTQYVGVALYTEEGLSDGFVQICLSPQRLEEASERLSVSSVLSRVDTGEGGIVFAIDKQTGTFVYHPDSLYIGKNALDCGMTQEQLKNNFSDFVTLDAEKYYLSSSETEDYFIYVGALASSLYTSRVLLAAIASGVSLLCLIVVFVLLTFRKVTDFEPVSSEEQKQTVNVKMPDGTIKKTQSAVARWSTVYTRWSDQTPEQKLYTVIRVMFSIITVLLCVMMIFNTSFFSEGSIIVYVLNGNWEKGLNVFALTGSIMVIALISTITVIIHLVLGSFASNFNAKVATVCRLLNSLTKYVAVVAGLYFCFALVGVDTATLLASAGILSLIIGLGAQTLVNDIVSGLFIIFEGEFRVGDVVTIEGNRGTVMEIGVRTTKIEEAGGNVRVISNSNIKEVLNMTKAASVATADYAIEYGESLERVEYVLSQELPNLRKKIPAITDGPYYKGVSELGDNSVSIRILATCAESDRFQVLRDMNREMKLIFDRHNINIPFPQVVVNQPVEFAEATAFQKRMAEKFVDEQDELSKNITEEH